MNRFKLLANGLFANPLRLMAKAGLGCGVLTLAVVVLAPADWWLTPDQRAQQQFDSGQFALAAQSFSSPERRGVALFRAGDFKAAASEFARVNSDLGHFNRATALVMGGQYKEAIAAYDKALILRPGWSEALRNQDIARLRASRTQAKGGDMTGGQLGADDYVFDNQTNDSEAGGQEQIDGGELSDQALQALWLRRVQTKPGDFLRVKFAFQHATQGSVEGER